MTEQRVKEEIGEENWDKFAEWMYGQTVGVLKDDKDNIIGFDYYDCDVEAFKRKLKTGYDRQEHVGWD